MLRFEDITVTIEPWKVDDSPAKYGWRIALVYVDNVLFTADIPYTSHLPPRVEGQEGTELRDQIARVEVDMDKFGAWYEITFQSGIQQYRSFDWGGLRDQVSEGCTVRVSQENIVFLDESGHGICNPAIQPLEESDEESGEIPVAGDDDTETGSSKS